MYVMYLDELECHLRCHVDALGVEFACLEVPALGGQGMSPRYIFFTLLPTLEFCSLLGGQMSTIEDNVCLYAVVPEKTNAVHGVVDIPEE